MTKTTDLPTMLKVLTLMVVMTSSCLGRSVVDLTHKLKEGEAITWPTNPRFNFSILFRAHSDVWDSWLENNAFFMPEHTGTHMDAPAHFIKGAWHIHQIPPERFIGPGVVVDVRQKVKKNSTYAVTVDDLKNWESQHGKMPEKAIVLVNAGWASRYPDWNRVFNTDNLQDSSTYNTPSVTAEASRWLAEERRIIAMGVDTPSPDHGRDDRADTHKVLLKKNIIIIESVANLNSVPPKGTTIFMGPINIYEGSGAPMRLLAVINDENDEDPSGGGCKLQTTPVFYFIAIISLELSLVRRLGL